MKYPYLVYSDTVRHMPLFRNLQGDPYLADLSPQSALLDGIDPRDQKRFQQILEDKMTGRGNWGLAPYLENRETLLSDCPQMVEEERFFHLGLDVIVDLGTSLHSPLDAVVQESGYEEGEGNYGGYVLLLHESTRFESFFSFYGHLALQSLPPEGTRFSAGEPFARIGDFSENGNWFYHTHIQVITQKGYEAGFVSKGYCSRADLVWIDDFCPSPLPLFIR